MTDVEDTVGDQHDDPNCKRCKGPVRGAVIMLHDRFPMHPECYEEVIKS